WIATDRVVALRQLPRLAVPPHPAEQRLGAGAQRRQVRRRAAERVSHTVDRANELRVLCAVAEGAPDLADQDVEIRVNHVRVRPDSGVQVALVHDLRRVLDQGTQEVERFRRQVDFTVAGQQLTGLRIDGELGESRSHGAPGRRPCTIPAIFLNTCCRFLGDSGRLNSARRWQGGACRTHPSTKSYPEQFTSWVTPVRPHGDATRATSSTPSSRTCATTSSVSSIRRSRRVTTPSIS